MRLKLKRDKFVIVVGQPRDPWPLETPPYLKYIGMTLPVNEQEEPRIYSTYCLCKKEVDTHLSRDCLWDYYVRKI